MYSLRMSVCAVPRSCARGHALLLPDADVVGEQDRRRRVDRHRGGDLAERDAGEQGLRVGERVDGDALAPDLAERAGVVRVVAHERGHVERGGETGLAVVEEIAEARVRLLRRAETRELPHRPEPAPVHGRVHAARERELARVAEIALVVEIDVLRPVERLGLDSGDRREELVVPLGCGRERSFAPGPECVTGRAGSLAVLDPRHRPHCRQRLGIRLTRA